MVAPLVKALGALVVGTPVAVVLGLTARSLKKQEDAAVPIVRILESPLRVEVHSRYLDKRTHEILPATSFKRGYVSYAFRVDNTSAREVKGIHLELIDSVGDPVGAVRIGDLPAHGNTVFAAKKSWNFTLEAQRTRLSGTPEAVLTWRSPAGRRRSVVPVHARRVLGESPSDIRQRNRRKAPVTAPIMA